MPRRAGLRRLAAVLALGALLAPAVARAQPQDRPLRLVLNVGLQTLDPISSPSFVTRNFAYMVFDTLVAMDGKGGYRPQMLDSWEASPDRLLWTFRLRPGLAFHDGTAVTAADAVASLRRWGQRDAIGRRLMAATQAMEVVDPATFTLRLQQPFGHVIEALGKPSVHVPFIMPARIADATPPTQAAKEIMGSGPFLFAREEWVPGERAAFRRNPAYQPREEPADGLAGGKRPLAARVEFLTMTDVSLRAAAITQGEVDYLEYAPFDYLPRFRRDRNLVISQAGGISQIMGGVSINHHLPPFDRNLALRRAVQAALDRSEIVAAHGLPADMTSPDCVSLYLCGTPYASKAGGEAIRQPSLERARALLQEAGYRNEPIVLLQPADSALINPMALVVIDRLKRAGFNLDVQTADWSSIAGRWVGREPVERGGWNLVPVVYTGFDLADPLSNVGIGYNCSGNQPWGYCVEAMKPVLDAYVAEGDPAKRKALAAELQRLAIENVTFPTSGQFRSPAVWRAELKGVIDFGFPVLWNIERAK
ncbi:ABC transporter substrate-binding protein [Roseicella frigidaeris]|uniref:ABC transporter substrate-binding protein n=1 Tax=Roseicella frigidaeris TaxID=2230885 RepID=A0A327M9V4_9PROT|nr:ABC transporter substrate-binding protein [Roseicella frigidaeris]RAI58944.1 ABC transporter substrate-binding protein [Roseicella frigidaeris]